MHLGRQVGHSHNHKYGSLKTPWQCLIRYGLANQTKRFWAQAGLDGTVLLFDLWASPLSSCQLCHPRALEQLPQRHRELQPKHRKVSVHESVRNTGRSRANTLSLQLLRNQMACQMSSGFGQSPTLVQNAQEQQHGCQICILRWERIGVRISFNSHFIAVASLNVCRLPVVASAFLSLYTPWPLHLLAFACLTCLRPLHYLACVFLRVCISDLRFALICFAFLSY